MRRPADGIPQDIGEHIGSWRTSSCLVSKRRDADHHAQAEQRSLVAAVSESRRRLHDPPPALAFGHRRLAQGKRFFTEQVAYIARKLDAIQEGPRTLLDNTMLLFCSSMLTGNHDARQLPVIVLGGGGGRIQGGRILDYAEKPERQMCRLYLSDDGQDERAVAQVWRRNDGARGGLSRTNPSYGRRKKMAVLGSRRYRRWCRGSGDNGHGYELNIGEAERASLPKH